MKVKVKKPVAEFIRNTASWIDFPTGRYYYLPLWYKELLDDNMFECYSFDKLPEELKAAIRNRSPRFRNIPINEK